MLAHASMAETTFESERVLAADTTVDVAAGDTLKIGVLSGKYTLTKTGGGELVIYSVAQPTSGGTSITLEGGTLSFALYDRPATAMSSAYLHLDASQTNTMTFVCENGTNFVSRWNDVNGGARYATHDDTSKPNWRDSSHMPFLRENFQNGLPVVDLGTYACNLITNINGIGEGYGGALRWSKASSAIREVFLVVSDTEDLVGLVNRYSFTSQNPLNGPFFVGAASSTYHFHRGRVPAGGHAGLFYSAHVSPCIKNGTNVLDGIEVNFDTALPAGFHTLNIQMTNSVTGGTFGNDRCLGFGGLRYAEALVFTSPLAGADRTAIQSYLSTKWRPVPLKALTLADGTALKVGEGVRLASSSLAVNGNVSLTGGGTLICPGTKQSSTGTVTVAGVKCTGSVGTDSSLFFSFVDDGEVTTEGDASCNGVSAGGKLVKSGPGELLVRWESSIDELDVREGRFTVSPLKSRFSHFHVDASAASTLTTFEGEGGTNFVTRWNDAVGGSVYATTSPRASFIPGTGDRNPFLVNGFLNNLPVVDFGGYNGSHYTNSVDGGNIGGWGAAMDWKPNTTAGEAIGIRRLFTVASDTEDVYTVRKTCPGADNNAVPFIGHDLYYHFLRSQLQNNGNPPLILMNNKNGYAHVYNEETRLDGTNVVDKFSNYPKGFHLLEMRFSDQQFADDNRIRGKTFGRDRSHTYGGTRIAECLVFTSKISEEEAARIRGQLMVKWFASTNAWEYRYSGVSVAEGAVASFPYAAVRVNGTMSMKGTVDAAFVRADRMAVGSASAAVTGCFDVLPGSVIELDPVVFGAMPMRTSFRVISAGRVAVGGEAVASGARLPVTASGALAERYAIRFSAGEDGIYATIRPLGLTVSFK